MDRGFEKYFRTIQFLEGLANISKQKDYMRDRSKSEIYLKRMRYFFESLGILHQKQFKFIHIAGTSGKGSATAMLHEILRASGRRVGSFTSPFVTTSIEKARVGDQYISPRELSEIVEYLKPYITKTYLESPYGGPSYFEIWFAIAILYFLRKKCEWVVLEVGLGGKYDPGVLLDGCIATALTNVDYDHTHLLGKTLTKIGQEKAGIMRRNVPFFTTEQRPHLIRMFNKIAKKQGVARLVVINPPASSYSEQGRLLSAQSGMDCEGMNTALVWEIAKYLKIDEQVIQKGIARARLPCRFEVVQRRPFVVLDGAHSVAKMRCTFQNLNRLQFRKLHLVIALAANKDIDGICKIIAPRANRIYITRFNMPLRKCAHPNDMMRAVKRYAKREVDKEVYIDNKDALKHALARAMPQDLVLVTGSFFLAGELRGKWYAEERILKTLKSF